MAKKEVHKKLSVYPFRSYEAWLRWLAKNFEQTDSIWIKLGKKNSGIESVTYEEARQGAIMYGWIDGLINGYDDTHYLIKFSPRRPRSKWSKINRGIAEQLIADGMMEPAGLKQVAAAQSDGRWEAAYDSPGSIKVPPELQKLIETNKKAKKNFSELSSANRYAFLYRIQNSKREDTRRRHIEKAFEMLKRGEVYHPELKKKAARKKK